MASASHTLTWVGPWWECTCGFLNDTDGGAFNHFNTSSKEGSTTSPTELQMGAEGQAEVELTTGLEMAVD